MRNLLPHLELFVAGEECHSDNWLRVVLDHTMPIKDACRWAIANNDEESLAAAVAMLAKPQALIRMKNGFARHFFRQSISTGDREVTIDVERLSNLIIAVILSADWARQYRLAGRPLDIVSIAEDVHTGASSFRRHKGIEEGLSAASFVERCGLSSSALVRWIAQWLNVTNTATLSVPVALIADRKGVITQLKLSQLGDANTTSAQLVPDLESALTPTATNLLTALEEVVPRGLKRSVGWQIVRPIRTSQLSGNSLQGAAAVALQLMNEGKQLQRGVLIVASIRDGGLQPVGGESLKLDAAYNSFKEWRSQAPNEDHNVVIDRVIVAADAQYEAIHYAGMLIEPTHTLAEAVASAAHRFDPRKHHDVAYAFRQFKAVAAIDNSGWTVTARPSDSSSSVDGQEVFHFGPDSRVDYRCETRFSHRNRCESPHILHYRASAHNSRIEASCEPEIENMGLGPEMEDYERNKRYFKFTFVPEPDRLYGLNVQVYDGYGPGNRSVHCHFWPTARYEKIIFVLDLSCFAHGHPRFELSDKMSDQPTLRFYREPDEGVRRGSVQVCTEVCRNASRLPTMQPTSVPAPGIWQWEIHSFEYGGIVWAEWERVISNRNHI